MKGRVLLELILLILLIPSVSAAVIFDDYVHELDPFEVDGVMYNARYLKTSDKAIVEEVNGSARYIMEMGECYESFSYKFCFEGVDTTNDVIYKNGKEYPGIEVVVYSKEPIIEVAREFSDTSVGIGEEIKVTVTVKNTGEQPADMIYYVDTFPDQLEVTSTTATRVGNKIEWESDLRPNLEKKFTYTFSPMDFIEYTSSPNMTYQFNGEEKSVSVGSKKVEVVAPVKLSVSLDPPLPKVDEESTLKVTVTNIQKEDKMPIKLVITIPEGIAVYKKSGLIQTENILSFSGNVDADDVEEVEVVFLPADPNPKNVSIVVTYTYAQKSYTLNKVVSFGEGITQSTASVLEPTLTVTPDAVVANDAFKLKAVIENIGEEDLYNIGGTISSSIFSAPISIEEGLLRAGRDITIYDKSLNAPAPVADKTYTITFAGNYSRKNSNVSYTFKTSKELKVAPQKKIFMISQKLDRPLALIGDNTTFTVLVKNIDTKGYVGVDVIDSVAKGVTVVNGPVFNKFDVGINEEVTAYTYTVFIPSNFNEAFFTIKTLLNVRMDDGKLYKTSEVFTVPVTKNAEQAKKVSVPVEITSKPNMNNKEDGTVDTQSPDLSGSVIQNGTEGEGTGIDGEKEKKGGVVRRFFSWFLNIW